ncbi:hypothetical protein JCGZ_10936 [Jatropha curcas]|uniref:Uncharacterized protein n=1 Tax=Jatropha curcas TaxID=180498 RepID=A0A067KUF5_JATCU|nr:hypothetical protein JCGZ_10936 [Jatropha curcas]
MEDDLREEVYLVALIPCWLCMCVLPHDPVNLIRPSTFKVASMITSGEIFSLAILILASIYRDLRAISTTTTLKRDAKMTSYSGQRMAKYYNETEVMKLFMEMKAYLGPSHIMKKDFFLKDNGKLSSHQVEHLINLRSSFLTLHYKNQYIIESYNPHR